MSKDPFSPALQQTVCLLSGCCLCFEMRFERDHFYVHFSRSLFRQHNRLTPFVAFSSCDRHSQMLACIPQSPRSQTQSTRFRPISGNTLALAFHSDSPIDPEQTFPVVTWIGNAALNLLDRKVSTGRKGGLE